MQKKWIYLMIAIGGLFVLGMAVLLKTMELLDIKQANLMYRCVGLIVFGVIVVTIYLNFRSYPRDYYVTRHYNESPLFYNILSNGLYSIILLGLMLFASIFTPVNTDTSIWSVIYYIVMTFCFMYIMSVLLGMIHMLVTKLVYWYIVVAVILFLTVPILFLPSTFGSLVTHIMMMNPLYYLINGMQQAMIIGNDAINRITYHLYFYCFMGLITVFSFALNDYVSQLRPNEHKTATEDRKIVNHTK